MRGWVAKGRKREAKTDGQKDRNCSEKAAFSLKNTFANCSSYSKWFCIESFTLNCEKEQGYKWVAVMDGGQAGVKNKVFMTHSAWPLCPERRCTYNMLKSEWTDGFCLPTLCKYKWNIFNSLHGCQSQAYLCQTCRFCAVIQMCNDVASKKKSKKPWHAIRGAHRISMMRPPAVANEHNILRNQQ